MDEPFSLNSCFAFETETGIIGDMGPCVSSNCESADVGVTAGEEGEGI